MKDLINGFYKQNPLFPQVKEGELGQDFFSKIEGAKNEMISFFESAADEMCANDAWIIGRHAVFYTYKTKEANGGPIVSVAIPVIKLRASRDAYCIVRHTFSHVAVSVCSPNPLDVGSLGAEGLLPDDCSLEPNVGFWENPRNFSVLLASWGDGMGCLMRAFEKANRKDLVP